MTETKHTPGPWRVGAAQPLEVFSNSFDVAMVMAVDEDEGSDCKEAQANARLIAAAPELLEALRKLAAVSECYCDKLPYRGPSIGHTCYRCDALSVIAKAEGRDV